MAAGWHYTEEPRQVTLGDPQSATCGGLGPERQVGYFPSGGIWEDKGSICAEVLLPCSSGGGAESQGLPHAAGARLRGAATARGQQDPARGGAGRRARGAEGLKASGGGGGAAQALRHPPQGRSGGSGPGMGRGQMESRPSAQTGSPEAGEAARSRERSSVRWPAAR